ncbi:MAG: hypothetical protein Tsb0021_06800 [Chlamydiales bacterium]
MDYNDAELQGIRSLACALLALSVKDLNPQAKIVDVRTDELGFICEIHFPSNIIPNIDQIEERMRSLLLSDLELHHHEMLQENALEMLHHLRQSCIPKSLINHPDPLIQMVKLRGHFFPYQGKTFDQLHALGAFSLLTQEKAVVQHPLYGSLTVTRYFGSAFDSSKKLKEFLKQYRLLPKFGHRTLAELHQMCLFDEESPIWLERGLEIKFKFYQLWCQWIAKEGYTKIKTPLNLKGSPNLRFSFLPQHQRFITLSSNHRFAEWGILTRRKKHGPHSELLDPALGTYGVSCLVCSPSEVGGVLISSLQSIAKFIRMFGIKAELYWLGKDLSPEEIGEIRRDRIALSAINQSIEKVLSEQSIPCKREKKSTNKPVQRVVFAMQDLLMRKWQGPSVQLVALKNRKQRSEDVTFLMTTCLFGPLERCIGILLETNPNFMHELNFEQWVGEK